MSLFCHIVTISQLAMHKTVDNTEWPLSAGMMRGWHDQSIPWAELMKGKFAGETQSQTL